MHISAVILAGGRSTRMGRDKAFLNFDGQPLLVRAYSTLRDSGIEAIFISGRPDTDYSLLPCPVLLDREPDRGPLAGLERALDATTAPLLFVLAVDLRKMTAEFVRKLASCCTPHTGALPYLAGHIEPLAAIYPKACHSIARAHLLQGRLAVRDFGQASLRAQLLAPFPVSATDAACFENWNTPADVPTSHVRAP